MRLVRTILAFAIALSLAMLPVGVSAAGVAMPTDGMQMHMAGGEMHQHQMHMGGQAEMSMDECCPDDMKGTASHTGDYKCGMGFCCVGGALALGDIRLVSFEFLAVAASKIAIPADQVASFRGASPPFRPPRI